MITSTAKRGRPQAYHRTAWGENIQGLTRLTDGRWKVSGGPTPIKFTEPDERLAVARFRKIEAARIGAERVMLAVGNANVHAIQPLGLVKKALNPRIEIRIPRDHTQGVTVSHSFDTAEAWAWFREQLLSRPQFVAQRIGIEQLGYLGDIKRPAPSMKLAELGDLYAAKPGLSTNEVGRSKLFWKEFIKGVGVETVGEITHDNLARYEKHLQGGKYAPKSILHRYRKVRTILAYAIKRGRAVEECRRALDVTAMLEIKDHTPLDPKPISLEDFWAIHGAAEAAEDETFAAMMLVALNCAMYAGEVAALKWDEIDLKAGTLVTRRPKTGVSRVAVLWPETVKAIKALPRQGDFLFYTRVRSYTVFSALDSWRKYRTAAKVGDAVVFGMVRDAAFTIACRSSTLDQARVLAGHRLPGASDHYIRRAPQFVADACRAIRDEFYGGKKTDSRKEQK